ncbi:MAG: PD-(D/E)XK nuclease family protein [Planctomycetales bacterium]|nr:PD-(D/E)XK nuclease family protein [Planctomycetales bacterium]
MIAFADPIPAATRSAVVTHPDFQSRVVVGNDHHNRQAEISETLTGRSYLSWSAISTYLRCPLKYEFHYLDQFPEEFVSSNLIFGSAIHSALEAYFNEHLASGRVLGVERLLEVYHEEWSQADLAAVQFGKSEDLASLGSLAERMLLVPTCSPASI